MTEMTTGHLRKPQQHSLGAQSLHYDVVVVKIELGSGMSLQQSAITHINGPSEHQ